jgi:hypothetical protein
MHFSITLLTVSLLLASGTLAQDPDKIESLLKTATNSHRPGDRALAAEQLAAVIQDSKGEDADFRAAIDLVVNYKLTEVIPTLITKIEREGYQLSLLKAWSREYPCTRALVQLGKLSAEPLIESLFHEPNKLRRDLMLYSLLGVLGPGETQKRLKQVEVQSGSEREKAIAKKIAQRAESLASLAPTHLAPQGAEMEDAKAPDPQRKKTGQ